MKKFLLFLMFAMFCIPWAANAQTEVQIGDGTATSNQVPIGTYYNYSITEMLYTADEIGTAGTISSISFYYMGIAAKDLPITVYMQNVDAADLSAGISLADADEVFSGTLSVTTTAGWVTINLEAPFAYDGTSNLLIGINKGYLYYFSGQSWQGTTTSATMARYTQSDSDGPYTTSTVPGSTTTTRPNIKMNITPSSAPVCAKPIGVTVGNVTPTSCEVYIEYSGTGISQNLRYKAASDADWTIEEGLSAMESSYLLSNLTPNSTYSVGVQTVCEDGTSGWTSTSFSTPAGIPLIEAFGTSLPTGWGNYSGLLSGVLDGSVELAVSSWSGWNFGENAVFDSHAYVNIYGTGCKYWLVTPSVLMENNVQLLFDVAYTAYTYDGTTEAPATTGTDDKFVVLINDGQGWSVLRQWDNAGSNYVLNNLGVTPTTVAIDLSSYAGQNIAIAFYGESTESNADNNLHIDNVSVNYIPNCAVPTSLAASNVTAHTADFTWESNADSWQVCVDNDEANLNTVTTRSYTVTGLDGQTQHTVKVRAICGNDYSDWTNPVTFTTAVACPAPTSLTKTELTSHSAKLGWTENGSADEWVIAYKVSADENFEEITVTENPYVLDGLVAETGYTFKVKAVCGGIDGESQYSSTSTFTTTDACPAPTSLQCVSATTSSATLNWFAGDATAWQLCLNGDTNNLIEVNNLPYDVQNLDAGTTYTFKVRATSCEPASAWSTTVSFTTGFAIPIVEPFDASSIPAGWTMYTGLLSNVLNGTATPASASYGWNFGTSNNVFDSHARVNIYGNYQRWLVTPFVEMEDNVQLMFDLALTVYTSGSNASPTPGEQADDRFAVLINNGESWTVLRMWDNNGSDDVYDNIPNSGQTVAIDLSDYAGQSIAIAFYGESTVSGGDNNLHIDNVSINYIPSCPVPTNFACTGVTATTATLSWDEGEADSWQICLNNDSLNLINVSEMPYTLENLTAETVYSAMIRANCGQNGESEWSSAITFEPTAKFVIGSGTATLGTLPSQTYYRYSYTQQIYTVDELGEAGLIESIGFYSTATNRTRNMDIYMVSTSKESFEGTTDWISVTDADLVFSGEVTFTQDAWTTIELSDGFVYDGLNNVAIIVDDNTGSYLSGSSFRVFTDTITRAHYAYQDDSNIDPSAPTASNNNVTTSKNQIRVLKTEISDCMKPTHLAASNLGSTSVDLSWTENGAATRWFVQYKTADETEYVANPVGAATNPFTLTGLHAETTYNVRVRPGCTDQSIKWSNEITFTTTEACPAPTALTVTPNPTSAEVSWNGFSDSYTIEWAEATAQQDPVMGDELLLQYDDGTYATSIGSTTSGARTWGVMYPAGMLQGNNRLTKVAVYEASSYYSSDYTINIYTGGDQPVTLVGTQTVTPTGQSGMHEIELTTPVSIDPTQNLWITMTVTGTYVMSACQSDEPNNQWWDNNADGVWTCMATDNDNLAGYGWMIRGYVTGFNSNAYTWNSAESTSPYTITGLNSETSYYVRVKGDCGTDGYSKWSTMAVFTTPSPCDVPSDLEATEVEATSATLSWTGYQNSYNVQYRTAVSYDPIWEEDFENGIDDWTVVAGENATHPSNGIWYTYNPSGLEIEAHSGTYCVSSWSWASSAYDADNWLITPQLELSGVVKYYVRTNTGYPDSYEVLLSTTDADTSSFTITLKEMAPAPAVAEWNEVILDLSAYAGQQGYIAIHHVDYDMNYLLIDDFGIYTPIAAGEWVTVSADTTTVTINGLEPNTEYEWYVEGINGQCDEIVSEIVTFKTEPSCYVPTDLSLDTLATDIAVLSWVSDAASFDIEVNDEVTENVTSPYTLAVEPATIYSIRLRANCGDSYSDWTTAVSFVTPCEAYEIPYEYGFETVEDLYCWSTLSANSDNSIGRIDLTDIELEAYDGDYAFMFSSYEEASAYDQMLISPEFNNTENGVHVQFAYQMYGYGEETFKVGYSTTTNDFSEFTWGDEIATTDTLWTMFDTVYPAGTKYVAVYYTSEYQYYLFVDGFSFTEPGQPDLPQVITLNSGTTWVSFNKEISLDDLKAALVEAAPGTAIKISNQNNNATYNPNNHRWLGNLTNSTWDVASMYMINVTVNCEITLEGTPINPADHTVTIVNGNNYLGFPFDQSMTLTDAFAGFAVNGDKVYSQTGSSTYNRGRWQGSVVTELEPGQGYIYKSAASGSRTFTFPASSR